MFPSHVAITGLGAVSPHGVGADALWEGLLAGRSTAGPIRAFDATDHRVRFACEVPVAVADLLPRRLARQTDRFAHMALLSAEEGMRQAGLLGGGAGELHLVEGVDADRVGVVIASGVGGIDELTTQHRRLLEQGPDRVRPYLSIAMPINMAAGQVAIRHGLGGPVSAISSACASSADAIGVALDMIRAGRVDVVLAGGSEAAINPLMMAGFDAAGAMSRRNDDPAGASRPFDVDRDGFVAGEGAAVLVLERTDHARPRGAAVLAHLAGYGATNDAHDPTRPAPGGVGAARALRLAIADAGMVPGDIDHVNAHGTSTALNDGAESAALRAVFAGGTPPVTASKSSIGHLLGAAGAIEAAAVVRSIQAQQIPPTLNLQRQDPACDVPVVTQATRARIDAVVSSSFGFGGHNAVLTFTR
jgi:3-oxoacyl-[acyl-carrier-protein] synthase II